jgi:hypothetical protein
VGRKGAPDKVLGRYPWDFRLPFLIMSANLSARNACAERPGRGSFKIN